MGLLLCTSIVLFYLFFLNSVNSEILTVNNQPICERPNEEFACGSSCDKTCARLNEPCPLINIRCNRSCYCRNGFARDDFGICIPEWQCPAKSVCRYKRF